jgi:hypothetical protein
MEAERGAAWAWNPARWRTHDGYVDYHSFIAAYKVQRRHRATMRLEAIAAVRLGQGGEGVASVIQAIEKEATD